MPSYVPETLSTYLVRTRRLLHDLPDNYVPNPASNVKNTYFSDADLVNDINDATAQRDLWSGGSRTYFSGVPLVTGQEMYRFADLFPANIPVLDVVNVILIYGSTRVLLDNPNFTDLTSRGRALTIYQNRPYGFARYGANQIYIDPAPGTQYFAEFDTVVLSTTFVNANDPDPLLFPYTPPVPFYAAYLAKLNQQQYDKAETFFGYFVRAMRDIEGSRVGQLLTAYESSRSGRRTS